MSGWNEGGGYEAEASDVAPAAASPVEVTVPEVPVPPEIPSQVASNEIVPGNADETSSSELSNYAASADEMDTIDPNAVDLDSASQSGAASALESEDVVSPEIAEGESLLQTNPSDLKTDTDTETTEKASPELIEAIRQKGREIHFVQPGTDEDKFLKWAGASANAGGPDNKHLLVREGVTKSEIMEEFIHGVQNDLSIIGEGGRLERNEGEAHAKNFMIRHAKLLCLSSQDVDELKELEARDRADSARYGF